MKNRNLILLAVVVMAAVASQADAYVYDVGPNIVNMSGSSCRTASASMEENVFHDSGNTQVKSGKPVQRLYCPIPRRGTVFYRGTRLAGSPSIPSESPDAQLKVNLSSVYVYGVDSSSAAVFGCFTFGTDKSNQTVYYGAQRVLCSQSTLGCSSNGASWTGNNTLRALPHSGLANVQSVNFGVICDLGALSTLWYTESYVTPN
jgi:hypothetical protein